MIQLLVKFNLLYKYYFFQNLIKMFFKFITYHLINFIHFNNHLTKFKMLLVMVNNQNLIKKQKFLSKLI